MWNVGAAYGGVTRVGCAWILVITGDRRIRTSRCAIAAVRGASVVIVTQIGRPAEAASGLIDARTTDTDRCGE